jgi:hypothetical protein
VAKLMHTEMQFLGVLIMPPQPLQFR